MCTRGNRKVLGPKSQSWEGRRPEVVSRLTCKPWGLRSSETCSELFKALFYHTSKPMVSSNTIALLSYICWLWLCPSSIPVCKHRKALLLEGVINVLKYGMNKVSSNYAEFVEFTAIRCRDDKWIRYFSKAFKKPSWRKGLLVAISCDSYIEPSQSKATYL